MKKPSPPPAPEPLQNYLLTDLIKLSEAELLKIAAEMLPYIDPPAAPGPWAIALKNFWNIDWIREQREAKTELKFAG